MFRNARPPRSPEPKRRSVKFDFSFSADSATGDAAFQPPVGTGGRECWDLLEQAIAAVQDLQAQCIAAQDDLAAMELVHRKALHDATIRLHQRDERIADLEDAITALCRMDRTPQLPPPRPQPAPVEAVPEAVVMESVLDEESDLKDRLAADKDVVRFRRHLSFVMAA